MKQFRTLCSVLSVTFLLSACSLTVTTDLNAGTEGDDSASSDASATSEATSEAMEESSAASDDGAMMEESSSEAAMEESSSEAAMEEASSSEGAVVPAAQTIQITADGGVFAPADIMVNVGDDVTLELTGLTGSHGFSVPDLGIDAAVEEGQTISVPLPTDTAGTFDVFNSLVEGGEAVGTVVVQE